MFRGSMFRRSYIPNVLCSEGPISRRFYVPKVLYSEGSMFRRFYIPKVLCSENPLPTAFFYQLSIRGPGINDDCACEKLETSPRWFNTGSTSAVQRHQ